MSRKDYKAIAEIIHKASQLEVKDNILRFITVELADIMSEDNHKFNRFLFFEACGMDK